MTAEKYKEKLRKPNYIDTDDPDEITLYARDVRKTGSIRLETFSSKRGPMQYRVGDEFLCSGRHYIIEKIKLGRP
jgi:hypothetical protein